MPGENPPRRVWNWQTKLTYNHWLTALVKGKCSSTKPTRLSTGVMCHPDTEQNPPVALPGFEPRTYCTASENFASVLHYSTKGSSHQRCKLTVLFYRSCRFYIGSNLVYYSYLSLAYFILLCKLHNYG